MNIQNKLFSVTNEDMFKTITFCGIKIKIKNQASLIDNLTKDVNSLKQIIKYSVDITKIPPTKGVLSYIQKANYNIFTEVDRVCRENNLSYWLNFGTLLGAVRHKGFIPWDDDIDLGMLREDYEKFVDIFNNSTKNPNYRAVLHSHEEFGFDNLIKIFDMRNTKYLFIDIFPYDSLYKKLATPEKIELTKALKACHQEGISKTLKDFSTVKELHEYYRDLFQEKYLSKYKKDTDIPTLYWGCEFYHVHWDNAFFEYDDIFPLRDIEFNGGKFFAPNKTENTLHQIYKDYMSFPKSIAYHSDLNSLSAEEIIELRNIAYNCYDIQQNS